MKESNNELHVYYTEKTVKEKGHGKAKREFRDEVVGFAGLDDLEDWIFGQMRCGYSDKHAMSFPDGDAFRGIVFLPYGPDGNGFLYSCIRIHRIDNEDGIIFSDGYTTNGQEHCSKEVQEWLEGCRKRQMEPKFHFVE